MIRAKLIYLRDKQAFEKDGVLRLLGKPVTVAKELKTQGIDLLHIVDLDALKGLATNFDVYDKLTYIMHVEVECVEDMQLIGKLLEINARVVVTLPARKLDLKNFAGKERLLVGKITSGYAGNAPDVHDVLIEDATLGLADKFSKLKKRVLVYRKDYKKEMEKLVFGIID